MTGKLLARGMMAGVFSACIAFVFAHYFGEPQIEHAVALETVGASHHATQASAHAHGTDEPVFSRSTQSGAGLLTGFILVGTGLGGMMALCLAWAYQRTGPSNPKVLALALAVGGFLIMSLIPGLKYPPNPPAVGHAETIGYRTALYFLMLMLSLLIIVTTLRIKYTLQARMPVWNAGCVGVITGIALLLTVYSILPTVNEVPPDFPADLLWKFRMSTFGVHFTLWAVLGVTFGLLAERLLTGPQRRVLAGAET